VKKSRYGRTSIVIPAEAGIQRPRRHCDLAIRRASGAAAWIPASAGMTKKWGANNFLTSSSAGMTKAGKH
jgi:hypothetical protein